MITFLENTNQQIKEIEAKASKALHDADNPDEYTRLMKEKALVLKNMTRNASQADIEMPDYVLDKLNAFSQSAANALKVNSIFYMSALLYPEEHQPGDPNDLETFIQELKES